MAGDFRDMFAEGKDLAEQSEILEQPGGYEGNPQVGTVFYASLFLLSNTKYLQDFVYGVGTDYDKNDKSQDST